MWLYDKIFIKNITNLNLNKKYWYEKIIERHKNFVYISSHNFDLTEDFKEFSDILFDIFYDTVEKHYLKQNINNKILNEWNVKKCFAYVTNKHEYQSEIHDHLTTSTINSVFYFNVPSRLSGGITFYKNFNEKILTYYPNNYDLLIFPNYLLHYPEISETEEYRVTINMEIICD